MLSVKNVKIYRELSEETTAHTCDVCWDGRKFGSASNRGHGDMTMIHITGSRADAQAAAGYAKTQPLLDEDGSQLIMRGEPQLYSLEELVDSLVEEIDYRKTVKRSLTRWLKKKLMFCTTDGIRETASPYSESLAKFIKSEYPDAVILNEMSIDDAVTKYAEKTREMAFAKKREESETRH